MNYRQLGKTDIRISGIGFGCVEIGQDYGIYVPGDYGKPDEKKAVKLVQTAVDSGINLFDTAPCYGNSEKILGQAIGSRSDCYIATKVGIPPEGASPAEFITTSINQSLRNLKREYLDIVQLHNATLNLVNKNNMIEVLLKLRKECKIRYIGASVYETKNALDIINKSCFDMLQIAYNILDQRMADKVMPAAVHAGIGILGRSAYFKGALTKKVQYLSKDYLPLKVLIVKIKSVLNISQWEELASFALRFCFTTKSIDSVLVGIRTPEELEFAIEAEKAGPLSEPVLVRLLKLGISDKFWLNPVNWTFDLKGGNHEIL